MPDNSQKPHIAVLGAGPAGAAAAYTLSRNDQANVTVLEQRGEVGGNAGSFKLDGIWCDHGSHRLHPVAEQRVLDDIHELLGDDLLWRPRHGRILLQKRWIHFPLKPMDLLLKLPKAFTASLAFDTIRKFLPGKKPAEENFATVLHHGLGPTLSRNFYYPYVEKLWGIHPTELAVKLAERRVSGSSVLKILSKIIRQIPGLRSKTTGIFFFPRKGFGQITEGLSAAAIKHGANLQLNKTVSVIERDGNRITGLRFHDGNDEHRLETDSVWSTLPITLLIKMISPAPPPEVIQAAESIRYRGMILIYLILEQSQFTEFDAHYFPELSVPISRMSEPKNYVGTADPTSHTVLCAELPADPGDQYWQMSDEELGHKYCEWLASVGLPVEAKVKNVVTRRLGQAYPVYDRDYEKYFNVMDEWLTGMDGLLTFGRQGLFAHDNTHHAMTMAYAAADCLQPTGSFDWERWANYRQDFESHVVED